jgi:hypothetical protein
MLTDVERKAIRAAIAQLEKVQESRRAEAVDIVARTFGQKLATA